MLILAGFILAFLAVLLLSLRGIRFRGRVRGAGLIMIGPIPIIFGTDKETVKILMILSLILIAVIIVLMLISSQIL